MCPFSRFPGNFKGLCKQIDHFPEDADYEADTAEYFLRECMQLFFFSFLPGSFLCWVLPSNPQSPKDQNYLEVPVSAEGRKKQSLPPFLLSRDQIFMYAVPSVCNTFPSLLCLANS